MKTPERKIGGSFLRLPWKRGPLNSKAAEWRGQSEKGRQCVLDALGGKDSGYLRTQDQWESIDRLAETIFSDNRGVPARDVLDLIQWLGRVSARMKDGPSGNGISHRIIDLLNCTLLDRWVCAGWRCVPEKRRPEWTDVLIDGLLSMHGRPPSRQETWGPVPPRWVPGWAPHSPNAQTDLFAFLDGYQKESTLMSGMNVAGKQRSGLIVNSCVALRSLSGATDLVDPRVVDCLEFFEPMYDHTYTDQELLRQAEAAGDRKILDAIGEKRGKDTQPEKYLSPKPRII